MLSRWSQFVPNMSADIRGHEALLHHHRDKAERIWVFPNAIVNEGAEELCESRGGRPGLPSLINLWFLWT